MRLYLVEVWNAGIGELAVGELGYLVRIMYMSMKVFTAEDSAELVQLAILGRFWSRGSVDMWDLEMELDYKNRLKV